jgi:hypothetical protein
VTGEESKARAAAEALPEWGLLTLGALLLGAAALADLATGPDLASLPFYLIPVAGVSYLGRRRDGVATALAGTGLWVVVEIVDGRVYDADWMLWWNSLTRLLVLLLVAVLLGSVMEARRRRSLGEELLPGEHACPHCGSTDTLRLYRNLVCNNCQRVSDLS